MKEMIIFKRGAPAFWRLRCARAIEVGLQEPRRRHGRREYSEAEATPTGHYLATRLQVAGTGLSRRPSRLCGPIEAVSKGGDFMPSVSPMPNGKFPPEVIERLEYAGDWLKVNAEAIYGTRRRSGEGWKEGADLRFTRSKDNRFLYAISLKWPGRQLRLESVHIAPDRPIFLLGVQEPLKWRLDDSGLVITIPESLQPEPNRPCRQAYAFKIESK